MTLPKLALYVLAAATAASACARPQDGQLFRHDVAAVSRFHVVDVNADASAASAELPDGTQCEGRVSRDGASSSPDDEETPYPRPDVASGRAVLVCRSNAVLKCVLTYRLMGGFAYGDCADQNGTKYTILF